MKTNWRTVAEIIEDVGQNGDQSLFNYNQKFDGCSRTTFLVTADEVKEAYNHVSPEDVADIKLKNTRA
ncbi:hypothetical protein C4J81_03950 [Deltaproteobacteria bacterium Smac51]|nr:hypothetical protein C4J81_03950 [Deltaproteobacteria bacterium Smac51]